MKNSIFFCCFLLALHSAAQRPFDLHAHRGGKGLMPENTIPAMLDAIDRGIPVLEMDLQITRDRKVVVAHDPAFNSSYTTTPEGDTLTPQAARKILLYNLSYDSIQKYDVGLKFNHQFPRQKKMKATVALLSDLLDQTEAYAKQRGQSIRYNIEIKSSVKGDGIHYPDLQTYIDLAMAEIEKKGITDRVIIQSFDVRALRILHQKYPRYALSYLVSGKETRSPADLVKALGFTPDIYSPGIFLVTKEMIRYCHQHKMKIIPGVENNLEKVKQLRAMGADGVITDYSDFQSLL